MGFEDDKTPCMTLFDKLGKAGRTFLYKVSIHEPSMRQPKSKYHQEN